MDEKAPKATETAVEFTLAGARDLKNTKMFGKMSPCAVLTVVNTDKTQVSNPAVNAGTTPSWNQRFTFQVPDVILQSQNPRPSIRVEIFDSSGLTKSLGEVNVPLAKPIAEYDQPHQSTLGVVRKGKVCGFLNYEVRVEKPSFAPSKGAPEYDSFVRNLLPPPPVAPQPAAYGRPAAHATYGASGYPAPPPGYHQPAYGAHYPQSGYPPGYSPQPMYAQPRPYGYPQQYPPQYGHPPQQVVVMNSNQNRRGMGGGMGGMGMGLMAGAAGGLLLGAALSDGGGFGDCGF